MSPRPKGFKHSAETRAKISRAQMGKTYSAETRAKISAARTGPKNPMFGKTLSAETRAKMARARMGKTHSAETRAKISRAGRAYWARLKHGIRLAFKERGWTTVTQRVRGEGRIEHVVGVFPIERVPAEELQELILRLPKPERALILKRFGFRGPEMTIPEAAKALGLRTRQANRLYDRALARLRRALEE